jgi:hypothetical protein
MLREADGFVVRQSAPAAPTSYSTPKDGRAQASDQTEIASRIQPTHQYDSALPIACLLHCSAAFPDRNDKMEDCCWAKLQLAVLGDDVW